MMEKWLSNMLYFPDDISFFSSFSYVPSSWSFLDYWNFALAFPPFMFLTDLLAFFHHLEAMMIHALLQIYNISESFLYDHIQLEGSGNWPLDHVAIEKTKSAFLLKIGER